MDGYIIDHETYMERLDEATDPEDGDEPIDEGARSAPVNASMPEPAADIEIVNPFSPEFAKPETAADRERFYTHTNFAACFLPSKRPRKAGYWEVANGNRSLVLQTGIAIDADGKNYEPGVPFGRYGRLAMAAIMDRAAMSETREIVLPSVGAIMSELNLPTSGGNARKLFIAQLIRVVACRMTLAGQMVVNGQAVDYGTKSKSLFDEVAWRRDEAAGKVRVPRELAMNEDIFKVVQGSRMPYLRQRWAELESPLAMDLYLWLTYQAPRGSGHPIPWSAIRSILAPGATTERLPAFRDRFERALEAVEEAYEALDGKIIVGDDGVAIKRTAKAVAAKKKKGGGRISRRP